MAWVRIDDQFTEHPKLIEAGPLGVAMQMAGLCYANRNLTDGMLPAKAVARFMPTVSFDPETGEQITWKDVANRLVQLGIWLEVEGGYMIHDYLKYQPSRSEVEAERAAARERMARRRSKQPSNIKGSSDEVRANTERISPSPDPVPNPIRDEDDARTRENGLWSEFQRLFVEAFGGLPNNVHYEEVDQYLREGMKLDVIVEAIRRAALNKANSWGYVRRTLQNWLKDKKFTIRAIEEAERPKLSVVGSARDAPVPPSGHYAPGQDPNKELVE